MDESFSWYMPNLGIGLFTLDYHFERVNRIGRYRLEYLSWSMTPTTRNKYKNVTIIINGYTGIVMGVIDTPLISHDRWSWHQMVRVIVIGDHGQKMGIFGPGGPSPDKEGFINFGCINGHRRHRMTPGKGFAGRIFIPVLPVITNFQHTFCLSQCKPDAPVPVKFRIVQRLTLGSVNKKHR